MDKELKGMFATGCVVVIGLFALTSCLFAAGCFGRTAQVVENELGPSALLKKYEDFKDIAARLDAKRASIEATEARLTSYEKSLSTISRDKWNRTQESEFNLISQELLGMKASYNGLAADYNARMAKENYRFCNVGDLPRGADKALAREYAPYVSK